MRCPLWREADNEYLKTSVFLFCTDMKQQVISFNCEEYSKLVLPKGIEEDTFHY